MNGFELKAWRQALGLSQGAAAAALGVSILTYRLWEWGKKTPGHARMVGLACRRIEEHPEELTA